MSLTNYTDKPNFYLLFSTSTFIIPMIYAFKKKHNTLSFFTALALAGSINYWRKPLIGYRRNIDLVTSNVSAFVYVYYGYNNILGIWPKLLGWMNLYTMYYFYNQSCSKFYNEDKTWNYYHIGFHLTTTISKMYIIFWL